MVDAEKRLAEICNFLIAKLSPQKIVLIGSRAKGTHHLGSDFDLVVVGERGLSFREERKLLEELDEIAGIFSVDLLFWERLSPEFKKVVCETGKTLYEKDRSLSCFG